MKRKKTWTILTLCLALLAGCVPAAETRPTPTPTAPGSMGEVSASSPPPGLSQDEVPDWVSCRIVDGAEEGELLLAELDYPLNDRELYHHDGKNVYRLSLNGTRGKEEVRPDGTIRFVDLANNGVSVYLDGEPAQPAYLRDGMSLEISFNGLLA